MVREVLVEGLEKLRESVYRGPVKALVVSLGLEPLLRSLYSSVLSVVSGYSVVSREVSGVSASFHVSTGMEVQRFRNLMDEAYVIESVLDHVSEDDVFYDVGANVGLYTCFVSQVSADTVAFEPHPENRERLRDNVELNELSNVTIRREALSDSDGVAELEVAGTGVAGEGTHSLVTDDKTDGALEVEEARTDSLVDELPTPDVVKIDVEGAELQVLRGMKEMLADCRVVYTEVHPDRLQRRGGSEDEVVELLERAGLSVEKLESRGQEAFLRAER